MELGRIFSTMDAGMGFYILKFESKSDYNKVLTGGPWTINGHYLTVQRWYGDFKADQSKALRLAVWLRIISLPAEYYDDQALFQIASALGRPLKLAGRTADVVRGSFARMCVEIDLKKPLEPTIGIGKHDYIIE